MAVTSKFSTGLKISVAFGITLALGIGGYAYSAHSVDRYFAVTTQPKLATIQTLASNLQTVQSALKQSETSTLAFLSTQNSEQWDNKKRADAAAQTGLQSLEDSLSRLPHAESLVSAELPVKQSATVVNLLETDARQIGAIGDPVLTARFVQERYLPARTELDGRLNQLAQEIETQRVLTLDENTTAATTLQKSLLIGWALQGGAILGAILLTLWLVNNLSSRLVNLIYTLRGLANGDATRELHPEKTGELGELTDAIREVAHYQQGVTQTVQAIAGGDLTQVIVPKSRKDALNVALANMVGNLQETVSTIDQKIKTLEAELVPVSAIEMTSETAGQVPLEIANDWDLTALHDFKPDLDTPLSQAAQMVARLETLLNERNALIGTSPTLTEQTRTLTSSVADAAEATAKGVIVIAETSRQTAELADDNQTQFRRTATEMVSLHSDLSITAETLLNLGKRSQEALTVIATLQETAERTDAIALNAAIEAARAGNSGGGIGAVAEQLRGLAERSAFTAHEVYRWVEAVQQETREAFAIAQRGSVTLEENIVSATGSAETLGEVTQNLQQIAQTATATEENAILTQQSAGTAVHLANEANHHAQNDAQILESVTQVIQELGLLLNYVTDRQGVIAAQSDLSEQTAGQKSPNFISNSETENVQMIAQELRERLSFFKVEMPANAAVASLLSVTEAAA